MKSLSKSIYIDALALVPNNKSGIGQTLEQTFKSLVKLKATEDFIFYLVVPLGKAKYLKEYVSDNVKVKTIPMPARLLQGLIKINLLPPLDWFLGQGIYIFPNYRNWPVWHSRSLTYIYDISYKLFPETLQVKNQKYLAKHVAGWIERTDKVITISEQVKLEIEEQLSVFYDKVEIVPCGVDTSLFKPAKNSTITKVKAEYEIPYDKYLLFVGNIEPRKNLLKLLEAYTILQPKFQNEYGLVIVGSDSWLDHDFKKKITSMQAAGLKVFKIKQYVETTDLPAIYSGASLLVHPAIYEGFGMTPLEAMACDVAVAVSDLPAIHEVVESAGYYFDPHSAESIATIIEQALSNQDQKAKFEKEALSRIDILNWQNSAEKLFTVIQAQQAAGLRAHPIWWRIKSAYAKTDRRIRLILGDKEFKAYKPAKAKNLKELRANIYNDFFNEEPAQWSRFLLRYYLISRALARRSLRLIYRQIRRA